MASPLRSDTELFVAVARAPALASRVVAQLERLISADQLRPGDRLPSERALSGQFGVSRTVVREAIHTLAARGLLAAEPGRGVVVRAPGWHAGNTSALEPLALLEVRRLLEAEIAALAAVRRTADDLAALHAALASAHTDAAARAHLWLATLAAATHNPLHTVLLAALPPLAGPTAHAEYAARVYNCVAAQDGAGARAAVLAHFDALEAQAGAR